MDSESHSKYYSDGNQLVFLIFFLQISHLGKIVIEFENLFNFSPKIRNLLNLMKLLMKIFIILHIFACFWLYIGFMQEEISRKCWMTPLDILKSPWYDQYIYAYYYMTVTMITVGYGDVIPVTVHERTIAIFTQLISCGVFAYSIQTVGQIIEEFYRTEKERAKRMYIIKSYMNKKNVNQDLQYQIKEYLNYYYSEIDEDQQQEQDRIIKNLSDNLRTKLLVEANKIALKESFIFQQFSDNIIQQTVSLIKERRCTPEEKIFKDESSDECALYFIEKGVVEINFEGEIPNQQNNKIIIQTLTTGEYFGTEQFFTGEKRPISIRCLDFCTFQKIERQDFINLLQQYQPDYERFCFIKDNIQFLENYDKLNMSCQSCNSTKHQIKQCPYLHLTLDKHNTIGKMKVQTYSQRKTFLRGDKNHFHSLANYQDIYECIIELNEDNVEYIQEYQENFFESEKISEQQLQNESEMVHFPYFESQRTQQRNNTNNSMAHVKSNLNSMQSPYMIPGSNQQQFSFQIIENTPQQKPMPQQKTIGRQRSQRSLRHASTITSEPDSQLENSQFLNNGVPNTPNINKPAQDVVIQLCPQKRRRSTRVSSFIGNRVKLLKKRAQGLSLISDGTPKNNKQTGQLYQNQINELQKILISEIQTIKKDIIKQQNENVQKMINTQSGSINSQQYNDLNCQYMLNDGEIIEFDVLKDYECYFPCQYQTEGGQQDIDSSINFDTQSQKSINNMLLKSVTPTRKKSQQLPHKQSKFSEKRSNTISIRKISRDQDLSLNSSTNKLNLLRGQYDEDENIEESCTTLKNYINDSQGMISQQNNLQSVYFASLNNSGVNDTSGIKSRYER